MRVRVAAIEQLGRVTTEILRAKTAPDLGTQRVLATLCVLATGRPSAGENSEKTVDEWLRERGYGMQEQEAREEGATIEAKEEETRSASIGPTPEERSDETHAIVFSTGPDGKAAPEDVAAAMSLLHRAKRQSSVAAGLAAVDRAVAHPDEPMELAVSESGIRALRELDATEASKKNGHAKKKNDDTSTRRVTVTPSIDAATNSGWSCRRHGLVGAHLVEGKPMTRVCSRCGESVEWTEARR